MISDRYYLSKCLPACQNWLAYVCRLKSSQKRKSQPRSRAQLAIDPMWNCGELWGVKLELAACPLTILRGDCVLPERISLFVENPFGMRVAKLIKSRQPNPAFSLIGEGFGCSLLLAPCRKPHKKCLSRDLYKLNAFRAPTQLWKLAWKW